MSKKRWAADTVMERMTENAETKKERHYGVWVWDFSGVYWEAQTYILYGKANEQQNNNKNKVKKSVGYGRILLV